MVGTDGFEPSTVRLKVTTKGCYYSGLARIITYLGLTNIPLGIFEYATTGKKKSLTNRQERRAERARTRKNIRVAKLRCVACEKVGVPFTKEHYFPLWLINHAKVEKDGITWEGHKGVNPRTITIPLCRECNHRLGTELEGPVSQIFPRLEDGLGISDAEAELLVRWLWKFEGLAWAFYNQNSPEWSYSDRWTLIDRILGNSLTEIRGQLTLAVGLINKNDDGEHDLPMGLDSGIGGLNSIFVSGVFGKTALMVCFSSLVDSIPLFFGQHQLQQEPDDSNEACFFPPVSFPFSNDAIFITYEASVQLGAEHEELARRRHLFPRVKIVKPKIIIP